MLRLFVALDLPDYIIDDLTHLFHGIPDARWSHPENLHITLKFIGETGLNKVEAIEDALKGIEMKSFDLTLAGLGSYRKSTMTPILWVGVEESSPLQSLKRELEKTLGRLQIPVEKRAFHPHLTIARMKRFHHERMEYYMNQYADYRSKTFRIDSFQLYSSQLRREGPVYTLRESYLLI